MAMVYFEDLQEGSVGSGTRHSEDVPRRSVVRVVPLVEQNIEAAGETLARSFFNDPLVVYMIPDKPERIRLLPSHFTPFVRYGSHLDHRRAAVTQQLDQREAAADGAIVSPREPGDLAARGLVIQEPGVEEVAAAGVGDEPAPRFRVGVAVDVDEPGHDEPAVRVDMLVDGARVATADIADAIAIEQQVAPTQETMDALVVGNDVAAANQRLHGVATSWATYPDSTSALDRDRLGRVMKAACSSPNLQPRRCVSRYS